MKDNGTKLRPSEVRSILVLIVLHAGVVAVRNVLIALAVLGQGTPVLDLGGDEGTVENVRQACRKRSRQGECTRGDPKR